MNIMNRRDTAIGPKRPSLATAIALLLSILAGPAVGRLLRGAEERRGGRELRLFGDRDDDDDIEVVVVTGYRPAPNDVDPFWIPPNPIVNVPSPPLFNLPDDETEDEEDGERDECDRIMDEEDFEPSGFVDGLLSAGAVWIRGQAEAAALEAFPPDDSCVRHCCSSNECDAFRHAYGMVILAHRFNNVAYARFVGDAHERQGLIERPNDRGGAAMDVFNNHWALDWVANNPDASLEEAREAIKDAVENGTLITEPVDCDG